MLIRGEWLILRRELRAALRRRRLAAAASLWIGAGALVTYSAWPDAANGILWDPAFTTQMMADQSRRLVVEQFLVMLFGLWLLVPALAAVSFTREREDETLDQLRLTLLRDSTIIHGKLLSVLVMATMFTVAVAPVFAIGQFLLGMENRQVIMVLLYLVVQIVMTASVGLACVIAIGRTVAAVLAALSILALVYLAPPALAMVIAVDSVFLSSLPMIEYLPRLLIDVPYSDTPLDWFVREIAPGPAVLALLSPALRPNLPVIYGFPLLVAAVAYACAVFALRRSMQPRAARAQSTIRDEATLEARRKSFPYYLVDPAREKPPIGDRQNPVLVREFRCGLFYRLTGMIRFATVVLLVSLLLFAWASLAHAPSRIFYSFVVQALIAVAVVPALCANAIVSERNTGNLDMLRMSLLPPRSLPAGKALGNLAALSPALLASVLAAFPALIVRSDCYFAILAGMVSVMVAVGVCVGMSIASAVVGKRSESVIAKSTIGSFALLFGMLAVEVIDLFVRPERYYVEWGDYWSAEPALLSMTSLLWSYLYYVADLRVVFGEFGIPRLAHYWVFSQALAVIITLALFQFAVLYFRRYRMRDV